jgi:hypothetical protein
MHRDKNILAYFTLVGAFVAKPLLNAGPVGLGQFSPTKASQFNQLFFCVLLAYPVSKPPLRSFIHIWFVISSSICNQDNYEYEEQKR